MTAVHIAEDPCANVQHTEELRDEHGFFVVFAKLPVRLRNYGGKIRFTAVCISGSSAYCNIFENGLGNYHEESCRNSFSGNIGDRDSNVILV